MALAIFGDIHGNLEALEAILKDIRKKRKKLDITDVFFLGDAISFGPNSREVLDLLQQSDIKCVIGNHEERVIRYNKGVCEIPYISTSHMEYVFNQLSDENLSYIRSMPVTREIKYRGRNVMFTHFGRDKDKDFKNFGEDVLDNMFRDSNCDIVFFGHVHTRKMIINDSGKSYCCLGSSGCVTGDKTFWTYFDIGRNASDNIEIYRIDVLFDKKSLEEKIRTTAIPEKERFAKNCFGINLNKGG